MHAQWTEILTWTVVYDANGGGGSMDTSTAQANKPIDLKANAFTRTACTFAGWAESKTGTMAYGDTVSVPGQPGETTLTLYALWDIESGQAGAVVTAATTQSGDTITLTGVAWSSDLKTALESALSGGGISLDLSGVSGLMAWASNTLDNSVKNKITSLTLPDTVTSISNNAFLMDTALKTVDIPAAATIGISAFYECAALETVKLPAAATIGSSAFYKCAALKTVDLPAAATIEDFAFSECAALKTVDLPAATTIGSSAFSHCIALETVKLPMAASIGLTAFADCTALADLYLPTSGSSSWPPTLAANVFQSTGNSGTLSIHVGTANIGAYETDWVVSENPIDAEITDTTGIYGDNHKAITIME
jgi:hypothetical protein